MTILLGFAVDDFVMLGADTRATQSGPGGLIPIDDNTQKIFRTGVGLMAGAGWFDLVRSVVARMETPPESNYQAAAILREERDKTGLPLTDPRIQKTSWLLSYSTGDPSEVQTGLAYCYSQNDYYPQSITAPDYFLVVPFGMSEEPEAQLRSILARAVKTKVDIPESKDLRGRYCGIIQDTVRCAATLCDSVSSTFQIGFHKGSLVRISPFLNDISGGFDWS